VKRTSETVQGSTKRQKGVRESRSNELSCVSRDITPLVVTGTNTSVGDNHSWEEYLPVDGDIQAHEFNEGLIIAKAKQRGEIVGVIFGGVNCRELSLSKNVAVDSPCDIGEFGDPKRSLSISRSEGE